MSFDELLDDLEPIPPEQLERPTGEEGETLHEALTSMLALSDRIAKSGYRAGQSTELVAEQIGELRDFVEEEVETRESELRDARSKIGELGDERDRLVQALMEVADLSESASEAAENELSEDVAERFERLDGHVQKVLKRAGLEPLASEGEPFDPEFHEAIDEVSTQGAESRTIVQVVRQGYRYRGDSVRIARVIVAE